MDGLTKTDAYEAGISAAADTKKTIKSNPWEDHKTKQEKALYDAFNRGYRDQMGFEVWAKGL